MAATIAQIISDAQGIIGEVSGSGVQTYDEDIMFRDVVRAFNMLFKKYDWDQFMAWFRLQLDGVTGTVTTDELANVKDFEDIRAVHRDKESRPLSVFASRSNPYALPATSTEIIGWTALPATSADYASKKIQVYNIASTAFINVHAKVYPVTDDEDWTKDDVMYLDRDLLAYATAFTSLISNGLNADGAELCQKLMESKYLDITKLLAGRPIAISGSVGVPNSWFERS